MCGSICKLEVAFTVGSFCRMLVCLALHQVPVCMPQTLVVMCAAVGMDVVCRLLLVCCCSIGVCCGPTG